MAWLFNAAGRLIGIEEPNGNRLTLAYTYDGSSERLTGVTQPGSRTTTYAYVPATGTGLAPYDALARFPPLFSTAAKADFVQEACLMGRHRA